MDSATNKLPGEARIQLAAKDARAEKGCEGNSECKAGCNESTIARPSQTAKDSESPVRKTQEFWPFFQVWDQLPRPEREADTKKAREGRGFKPRRHLFPKNSPKKSLKRSFSVPNSRKRPKKRAKPARKEEKDKRSQRWLDRWRGWARTTPSKRADVGETSEKRRAPGKGALKGFATHAKASEARGEASKTTAATGDRARESPCSATRATEQMREESTAAVAGHQGHRETPETPCSKSTRRSSFPVRRRAPEAPR